MTEPVATLPACLCGLDTNPVASPRMDIHCPKHDAPGGEPESDEWQGPKPYIQHLRERTKTMDDVVGYLDACHEEGPETFSLGVHDMFGLVPMLGQFPVSRVSQPADWLKDKEIERLTDERNQLAQQGAELWERANTAQPSPTPADEEIARDVVTTWVNRYIGKVPNSGTYAELEQRITTALAEARRAQREEDAQLADSWEHEDKVNPARWIASAIRQQVPAQGTPTTDARAKSVVDHLFTILARDYNIELTNNDASELTETVASALSSTPSKPNDERCRCGHSRYSHHLNLKSNQYQYCLACQPTESTCEQYEERSQTASGKTVIESANER